MTESIFILSEDVIESALLGVNLNGGEDEMCSKLAREVRKKSHKLIISQKLLREYLDKVKELKNKERKVYPDILTYIILVRTDSNIGIMLIDSPDMNPKLTPCENKVVNLALDEPKSIVVTQRNEFIRTMGSLASSPKAMNPSEAYKLIMST